jgi:hypothetical protein
MIPLSPCEVCARHVRVSESLCPFCGEPRRAGPRASLPEAPRGGSRAWLTALGATLAVEACQSRTSGAAQPVGPLPQQAPHPVIAAPYGAAPPPPQDAGPEVRVPSWLVTLPDPIPMGARATTPLEISATNPYDAPIPSTRDAIRLLVNGVPSPVFDLAFGNGVRGPEWEMIPPRSTARDRRMIVEALMPAPGEYALELQIGGRRVAARRVRVTP